MGNFKYRNDRLFAFHVETVRAGQPRPYADGVHEYIVTDKSESCFRDDEGNAQEWDGFSLDIIKQFCVACLRNAKPKGDASLEWHEARYTLEKIGPRKYRYTVTEPNLD